MDKIEKVIQSFRKKINEESPTMSLGKGGEMTKGLLGL